MVTLPKLLANPPVVNRSAAVVSSLEPMKDTTPLDVTTQSAKFAPFSKLKNVLLAAVNIESVVALPNSGEPENTIVQPVSTFSSAAAPMVIGPLKIIDPEPADPRINTFPSPNVNPV